ncbi:MAG TPA: hypothetical protein PLV92_07375, partial [Pirellulaceae bacterium]|nr:hypothetical protein [Pirellulaceae bacterium]
NTLNADSITIGGWQGNATMAFGGGGKTGGAIVLQGKNGAGAKTNLSIGDNSMSTGAIGQGVVDLSSGTVQASVNQLRLGRHGGGAGGGQGTLSIAAGQFAVDSISFADASTLGGVGAANTSSSFNNTSGTLNLTGGTLRAGTLEKFEGGATFNWSGGTIQNVAGADLSNVNVPIDLLTSATHTLSIDAGRTATFSSSGLLRGAGPLAKTGAGDAVLFGANTYTDATTISSGALRVDGSLATASAVTVESTGRLTGVGTIGGPVTSAGSIAPGAATSGVVSGIINSGAVSLTAGWLTIDIGGADAGSGATKHDQWNVAGTVSLGDGLARLSLAGAYVPQMGDDFVLIANDGADYTTGYLLDAAGAPLFEGAPLVFNGKFLFISYNGGDGNDVVLNTTPIINGTDAADSLTISATAGFGLQVWLNSNPVVTLPGPLTDFTYNGRGEDDLFTVQLNGFALPTGGVFFNGQSQASPATSGANSQRGDTLRIIGSGAQVATYLPDGVANPTLDNDGVVTIASQGAVAFTGLEPIDLQNLALVNLQFPNANDELVLSDGVDAATNSLPALVVSGTSGGVAFESVHLRNNGAVAISTIGPGGNDGLDRVTFASVATGHGNGAVSIDTGANTDTLSFSPLAGPVAVSLQGRGGIDGFSAAVTLGGTSYSLTNIDNVIGSSANGNSTSSGDTVTLDLDVPAVWNITGAGAGDLQVTTPSRTLTFSGIENLVGASNAQDRFVFGAGTPSLAGRIDGRGALNGKDPTLGDLLDYSAYSVGVSVDLTTGDATGVGGGLATDLNGSSIEQVFGSAWNDVLVGDVERNVIMGRAGDDSLRGMTADDTLDGEAGDDTIQVAGTEAEFDVLQGGAGQDRIVNVGTTTVTLNRFNAVFDAVENGIEQYVGGGYGLKGNASGNGLHFGFTSILNTPSISGAEGIDDVTTSPTNVGETFVVYDGGAGDADHATIVLTPDQLAAFTASDVPALQAYLTTPTGKALTVLATPSKGNLLLTNFEQIELAVADDGQIIKITPYFLALAGRPQLIVGGKTTNDSLTGTPLTDLIFGQGGNDWVDALDSGDVVFGGAGDDTLQGNLGADRLIGGSGNDQILGGAGDDSLFGGTGRDSIWGGTENDWLFGGVDDDALFGDAGADVLLGETGADSLSGGGEADTLNGGVGIDSIGGDAGADRIEIVGDESEFDTLFGGSGVDVDELFLITGVVPPTLNSFSMTATSVERIRGNLLVLQGNSGANALNLNGVTIVDLVSLNGLDGDDVLTGSAANDVLIGGAGADYLNGLAGNDSLDGGAGGDTLYGGLGDDLLNGGVDIDQVYGESGNDTIQVSGDEARYDLIRGGINTDKILNIGAVPLVFEAIAALTMEFETWDGAGQPI